MEETIGASLHHALSNEKISCKRPKAGARRPPPVFSEADAQQVILPPETWQRKRAVKLEISDCRFSEAVEGSDCSNFGNAKAAHSLARILLNYPMRASAAALMGSGERICG